MCLSLRHLFHHNIDSHQLQATHSHQPKMSRKRSSTMMFADNTQGFVAEIPPLNSLNISRHDDYILVGRIAHDNHHKGHHPQNENKEKVDFEKHQYEPPKKARKILFSEL